ncbi:MAG: hypothetical protein KGH89_09085 [Thaumarchaeota archaeon]|nr:hypothetical protein [Nitrososphaerota archaeon]
MKNSNDINSNPVEFCDLCFRRTKPILCEVYKNTFTKITSIHFSQQAKLDRVLNKFQITPRIVDRRWTCVMDASTRKDFLDSLWGIGVSVHTLDDHVKVLTQLYKPEIRKLGEPATVEFPSMDSWEEFDPATRTWVQIKLNNENEKITAKVNLGNIIKCIGVEETSYYRVNKKDDSVVLVPIEKRAAYNIMCTIAKPTMASWKTDDLEKQVFIELKELSNIPDEIFSFLNRLGSKDKRVPNTLVFENDDIELVRTALSCIKVNLENSPEIVDAQSDINSGNLILIKKITKERLSVLLDIIKAMGGAIEIKEDHLTVSGKRGSVKLTFSDDDKSTHDGSTANVSVSALEDPPRFSEILSMIKKRLGLLDVPLESMLSRYWPILTDYDLKYVVQSAISWYSSNPILAVEIISEHNKLDKIKEWNTKIKEGKIRSSLDTITLGKIIKRMEPN